MVGIFSLESETQNANTPILISQEDCLRNILVLLWVSPVKRDNIKSPKGYIEVS